jgi:nucleoside-diphosphate-sugar epimerase
LVLLTGPNGFVGAHVLSALLSSGYRVRGVVRSLDKAAHLKNSHAQHVDSGDLTFECVADIQREGALDTPMADVDYCCHVASPYFVTSEHPVEELIEPAVNGTRNVMSSALKATKLKRLTVLSSFAAVVDLAKNPRPGYVYTSADWDPLTRDEGAADGYLAYHVSKTEAEKAVWEMHRAAQPPAHFDICTLCPPMIYGPPLHEVNVAKGIEGLNTSLKGLLGSVTGQSSGGRVPTFPLPAFVDVRDVADAHVAALALKKGVSERFTLCGGVANFEDGMKGLRDAGEKGLGSEGQRIDRTAWYSIDRTRAEEVLGLTFIQFEQTVGDTWKWAKEAGIVA